MLWFYGIIAFFFEVLRCPVSSVHFRPLPELGHGRNWALLPWAGPITMPPQGDSNPRFWQVNLPFSKICVRQGRRGLKNVVTRAAHGPASNGILSNHLGKGSIGRFRNHHVSVDRTIPMRIVPEIYGPTWHTEKASHQSSRDRKVGWAVTERVAGSARYIWRMSDTHAARCLIWSVRSTRYETGPPGGHVEVSCVTQSPDMESTDQDGPRVDIPLGRYVTDRPVSTAMGWV